MFSVSDVAVWNVNKEYFRNKTKNNRKNIECIYEICRHLIDMYGLDIKTAKKKWKKVKSIVNLRSYMKTQWWCGVNF